MTNIEQISRAILSTANSIPSGWKLKKLGDALTLKRGYDLTGSERIGGTVPVISSSGFNGFHDIAMAKAPGIVMGRYGTVGEIFYIEEDFWPHNTTLYVAEFKLITPLFTYYLLQSINYHTYSGKSAVPGVNRNDLHIEKVLIPPIPEQKAIAHILGLMDNAINQSNQLIAQKELRKKWLMQNLLTGKKRLKGLEDEWKEHYLGEMFTERNDTKRHALPLLSVGAYGIYPQIDSTKKDSSNEDKSKYKRVCSGDIGYNTMRMWQGRSALSSLEGIVSPAYTIVTPRKNADSLFFSYLFKTPKLMNLFWRNSQGLVDDTLNCKFKDFSIIKLILPIKEEQSAIAEILQAADKEIQLLKKKTEKLKEQKKGLMQVLLTGKKRLKI